MRQFNQDPTSPSPSDEQTNPWDNLHHTQPLSETMPNSGQEPAAQSNHRRHELRTINAILYGPEALSNSTEGIDESDILRAFSIINSGQFTPSQQSNILRRIKAPDTAHGGTPERVFQNLDNRHSRRILAFVNGIPDTAANLQQISSAQISSTLQRYPTPVEFASVAEAFLSRLKETNTTRKYQEYAQDLETFKHQLYGKRQEYYEAFQSLESQAAQYAEEQAKRNQVLNTFQATETTASDPGTSSSSSQALHSPEIRPHFELGISRVDPATSAEILRSGHIDGDPFILNHQSYRLTPEYLQKVGLSPEYQISLDSQTNIAFSRIYQAQHHEAVTAYVRSPKGTKIVSYYRSNSQGSWRYLPDYVGSSEYRNGVEWLGKSYTEEALNLPVTTQAALEFISSQPHLQQDENNPFNSSFVFVGTAKRYESKDEYHQALASGTLRGDFYQEVSPIPKYSFGQISSTKRPPEELDLTGPFAPNFDDCKLKYQLQSAFYGVVNSLHYLSNDQNLLWTFNQDKSGHAWIGGVEVTSSISSTGVHTEWAQAGDYGTPLYEYHTMASGYGDQANHRGKYVSMWNNYLSRMPIIHKFLSHENHPTPTGTQINPLADSESYWAPEAKGSTPTASAPASSPRKKGLFSFFRK